MGLPTKPPARKIPEREAGEPELTAEVAGLRVGKYQRPLVEAIRSSRLAGCAQRCQGHRRRPGTLGPVCNPRLAVCTTCWTRIHLLPILSPLAWKREWYYIASYGGPETRRVTRKWQGEICGPSFRLPLSTGGTSQLDTCKQPRSFIPSLIHLFIQPEKCLLRGSLSVPICKTERVTAPQWAVVEITDVSM